MSARSTAPYRPYQPTLVDAIAAFWAEWDGDDLDLYQESTPNQ